MTELVGREAELATIDRFLDEASRDFRVLRIEGDAGIGKSALVDAVADRASVRGARVLRASPAGTETQMAFVALTDVLAPIANDDLAWLPDPQRVAIEVVLLMRSHGRARVLPRAVHAGALALLERAAEERPLVVAIDDEQWLDAASASALAFAVRRLDDRPVGLVVARRRAGDGEPAPPSLDPLRAEQMMRLVPAPLSLSATYHLVRSKLGLDPPRPLLRRIHQASGGNPLFALEIARAVTAQGADQQPPTAGAPLFVPETLTSLVARRLGHRTEPERLAMAVVAVAGEATHELVRAVDRRAAATLGRLVTDGIFEWHADRLRYVHPVLADVSLGMVDAARRRAIHALLATKVEPMEARARHRALAAEGPDASAADELTEAADLVARTSAEGACELLELAILATPSSEASILDARRLALARLRHRTGDSLSATALVDGLLAHATDSFRATVLEFGAHLDWVVGSADRAEARCREALDQNGLDGALRARVLVTLARVTIEPSATLRHAHAALELIQQNEAADPEVECGAIAAIAGARAALGEGIPEDLVERGLVLEGRSPSLDVADRLSASLGVWLKYEGRLEEARTWLRRTRDAAVAEGDESSLPYALSHLPQLELWTGDWDAAEGAAREHLALAEWTGQHEQRLSALFNLSLVDAHRGRSDDARRRIADGLPDAERIDPWNVYQLLSVLGFVELSEGRLASAIAALQRAHDIYEAAGAGDTPAVFENLSEALVAAGNLEDARDIIGRYRERAKRLGRPMNLAPAARCASLLAAAEGNLAAARVAIDEALAHHADPLVPFSRARSLLVAGQIARRLGERRAARHALDEARATFAHLGSPLWLARADRELARIPIRRAAARDGLTPTEERIASLVRRGLTNREVAAEVFVTTKTVEANLTRIYAKLGVRSRAELAAQRASEPAQGPKL